MVLLWLLLLLLLMLLLLLLVVKRMLGEIAEVQMWKDGALLAADVEVLAAPLSSRAWGGGWGPGVGEVRMGRVGRHVVEV